MPWTPMTTHQAPSPFSSTPLVLTGFDAFDNTNGMALAADGATDLEFMLPADALASVTVTIHGTQDVKGRTEDITQVIAAGDVVRFQAFPNEQGWVQPGTNLVRISATDAIGYLAIKRAVG